MNKTIDEAITEAERNLSQLRENSVLRSEIERAVFVLSDALKSGSPVLVCGNGGSASDALHITGELVGRFRFSRPALNVICLNANVTVMTAWANDEDFDDIFSRQVEAHGCVGGVLIGITTSGNSANVIRAMEKAQEIGMRTIGLTGENGGLIEKFCDVGLSTPGKDAPSSQNMHVVVYHYICEAVEQMLFTNRPVKTGNLPNP